MQQKCPGASESGAQEMLSSARRKSCLCHQTQAQASWWKGEGHKGDSPVLPAEAILDQHMAS